MNKNQWMDALTLWWSITWRLYLSLVLLLLVSFSLIYLFDTPVSYQEYQSSAVKFDITLGSETQYYIGSGLLSSIVPFVVIISFYLVGWSGKHALNNPLGKREFPIEKITLPGTLGALGAPPDTGAEDTSWFDGFKLQWGVGWRVFVISLFFLSAIENAPQSLVWELFQFVFYVLIGLVATRWLIAKPIGRTTFLVQLKQ